MNRPLASIGWSEGASRRRAPDARRSLDGAAFLAVAALSLVALACDGDPAAASGSGGAGPTGTTGGTTTSGAGGSGGQVLPPFHCDLATESPSLDPVVWQHPTTPLAGETVTYAIKSQNTAPPDAPELTIELVNRDGTRSWQGGYVVGGANALYYVSVADLAEGDNCVAVRSPSGAEVARKIVAPAPAPVPRGTGPWKVTSNHQWTCGEQPTFGNLLHVNVLDEGGEPIEGAVVRIDVTDDTVFPVGPDDTAQSWAEHASPKELVTDAAGHAELVTPWGEGIRSPIDSKPGLLVFNLSVDGGASDTATEITTGLWETNAEGCNYCSTYAVNVYGHWSHTVELRRDPAATEICDVPSDHAGQAACAYGHFYHDPERPSCRPVGP